MKLGNWNVLFDSWDMPTCEFCYGLAHVRHTYCPINLHYDMPNSVVRTNCSIKPTNPTGSSLTPTCPGRCFVPEVINKFPMVCLIEMNGSLYHKQFSNTCIHAQVPFQVSNKFICRHASQTLTMKVSNELPLVCVAYLCYLWANQNCLLG